MENRRRELARKRRKRQRQIRRRILAGGLVLGTVCLGTVGWLAIKGAVSENKKNAPTEKELRQEEHAAVSEPIRVELVPREENVTVAAEEKLPVWFDLREQGQAPTVPDQGTFGTCWAFASLGALESSMPEALRTSLSADHMSLRNSFGLGQDDGGDYSISTSYLLAWQGPVAEAEDPYGDRISPENLSPVCHLQEFQILPEKDYEAIKRGIYETGGVQSSFYMPQAAGADRDRYFNDDTDAFYYNGSLEANHDIVIVGWDDAYPKENFVTAPSEDGAFLCMNTWGESFGDRGYFYVSYEDTRIGTSNVLYTRAESPENYENVYQTDLCGWTGQLGYGDPEAWFANVYETGEDCGLAAAGFYATAPDTSYEVYVEVLNREDADRPMGSAGVAERFSNRQLVAEGHLDYAGFYTIDWEEPIDLACGDHFAVIVKLYSSGTNEPVAVEYVAGNRTRNVRIDDGEGYISPDGVYWQRAEKAQNCNVCLKAYVRKRT